MRVVVVPVLADNYAYLLIDDAAKVAACVDPAEPHPVYLKAQEEGVTLVGILTTHKHMDHAGGNGQLASMVPGIQVYGGVLDDVQACTRPLQHEDVFMIGGIEVKALHTPGHTRGSISYYCVQNGESIVFTGDTMFVGGCGRLFEGTPQDMYNSMVNVLGKLPETTKVYVGHEYTIRNLEFAVTVEKENDTLQKMLQWAQEQRVSRKYTVPSTLSNEWAINPFMRSGEATMQSLCPGCTPVDIFATLRKQKDRF
mmetsp:Transcript_12855/g.30122  ORF Transcript_12855/g.30122 Transcript_12855/m.30122 type:complete len:254 (+) Transcript_12855:68-829(+)